MFWFCVFGPVVWCVFVFNLIVHRSRKTGKDIIRQKWRHVYPRVNRTLQWGICGFKILDRLYMRRSWAVYFRWLIRRDYRTKFFFFAYYGRKLRSLFPMRYFWCTMRRCMPCSRKSNKFRMGKGRGHKVIGWYLSLNAGTVIVEYLYPREIYFRYIRRLLRMIFSTRLQYLQRRRDFLYTGLTRRNTYVPYYFDLSRLYYGCTNDTPSEHDLRYHRYLVN